MSEPRKPKSKGLRIVGILLIAVVTVIAGSLFTVMTICTGGRS